MRQSRLTLRFEDGEEGSSHGGEVRAGVASTTLSLLSAATQGLQAMAPGVRPGHTVMNFQELIADRRTIHDYRVEPLPEGALERGLTVALTAPNHRMTEPWRFVRVGPNARARLVDISADLKSGGAGLGGPALDKLRAKMLSPAELIVVCQVRSEDPDLAREDYAAVACSIQSAMLAWWSEGIGSKWSTGGVTTDARTYDVLGVDPSQEEIVGFLWAGYSARETPKPRRRRALAEVLRVVP